MNWEFYWKLTEKSFLRYFFENLSSINIKKAGRFKKLLGFARSHSILRHGLVSLSCATSPFLLKLAHIIWLVIEWLQWGSLFCNSRTRKSYKIRGTYQNKGNILCIFFKRNKFHEINKKIERENDHTFEKF